MEGNWHGKDGANKYQYNEKEWNDDFGLGWNDYGTRMYDPAMARFSAIDLLADNYSFQTPYAYAANNPIRYRDFRGMNPEESCNCFTEKQMMMHLGMQWLENNQAHNMDQHGNNPAPPQPQQAYGTATADPSLSSKGTPMVQKVPFEFNPWESIVTLGSETFVNGFLKKTREQAEQVFGKILDASGYDGSNSMDQIAKFIIFFQEQAGYYDFSNGGDVGVFGGAGIFVHMDGKGIVDVLNPSEPSRLIETGDVAIPNIFRRTVDGKEKITAGAIARGSHLAVIRGNGFKIEFFLHTYIGSNE
jgi:RHS repeat-associated protein